MGNEETCAQAAVICGGSQGTVEGVEPESKEGEKGLLGVSRASSCLLWGEDALLFSSSLLPKAPGDPQSPLPAARPHWPPSQLWPAVPEKSRDEIMGQRD